MMNELFIVTGTFACTLKFRVKDCDPNTGEPDDDGYDDEYSVSYIFMQTLLFCSPLYSTQNFTGSTGIDVSVDVKFGQIICVFKFM